MATFRHTALTLAIAAASMGSWAQTAAEHEQHHPGKPAAAKPSGPKATPAPQSGNAEKMAAMDAKMKAMREMREKMASAKTPEERQALMAEHMKTMQEGMAMMKSMGGSSMGGMQGGKPMPGNMVEHHQMMEKRMEMMESMMQMMMDRMAAPTTK